MLQQPIPDSLLNQYSGILLIHHCRRRLVLKALQAVAVFEAGVRHHCRVQCLTRTLNIVILSFEQPRSDSSLQLLDLQEALFVDVLEIVLTFDS